MSRPFALRHRAYQALALIVVVYVLALLATLTFTLTFRSQIGLRQTQLALDQVQQNEMALAACAQACQVLARDDPNVDSYADAWSGWHALAMPPGPGTATTSWQAWWRLDDESAKINVNRARADMLGNLAGLDGAAVASILDWIDTDDIPNPEGAEKEYYAGLSPPYTCRNGLLEALEELVFIKGITPELYFGAGVPEQTDHGHGWAPEQSGTAHYGESAVGLNELLTVYGNGRINLNTVRPAVLQAIPFLSDAAREEILSRQQPNARRFTTVEDIQSNSIFTLADKTTLVQVARFNSGYFQFRVRIQPAGMSSTYEYAAILERGGKGVGVLRWQRKLPPAHRDE